MILFSPDIPMSDDEFVLLKDLVYQYCGLHFTPETKYLLEKRLAKRLQHHKLESFRDYYYMLRYGQDKEKEFAEVVDSLTTNETYFFREDFQLKSFTDEILPEIRERKMKTGTKRLRIWSAGCSSGEEPYSIAMLLLDLPQFNDWNIDIIGTDISHRVLRLAREGIYGASSFRSTSPDYQQRYFIPEAGGKLKVADRVRKLVTFSHLNLFDSARIALLGKMDVIFCRNVIIYFDVAAKKRVVENYYERLHPEGFLLLGHSESLIKVTNLFQLRHFKHDMVYQRPKPLQEMVMTR